MDKKNAEIQINNIKSSFRLFAISTTKEKGWQLAVQNNNKKKRPSSDRK